MDRQELFNRITSNLNTYNRLQYAIKIEIDKPGPRYLAGLYQASGDLLIERKALLAEYSQADMIIFRSTSGAYFWLTAEQLKDWQEPENEICQRLLSDGTWQSEEGRQWENLKTFNKISGD